MARKKKDNPDDWRRFNKFKSENEKLRKEVTKWRKLAQESSLDKLEARQRRTEKGEDAFEKEILCEQCGNPDVKTITIPRADGKFELVMCKSCGFRSELKKIKETK
jgi:hypothetical protein